MPGFGSPFQQPGAPGAQADTQPMGGAPAFNQMAINPQGTGFGAQMPDRTALDRAEQRCAQGDGANCMLAQRLRQQYEQAMGQYNQGIQGQQMKLQQGRGSPSGMMGTQGRGGAGYNPSGMAANMLSSMYGRTGGGY